MQVEKIRGLVEEVVEGLRNCELQCKVEYKKAQAGDRAPNPIIVLGVSALLADKLDEVLSLLPPVCKTCGGSGEVPNGGCGCGYCDVPLTTKPCPDCQPTDKRIMTDEQLLGLHDDIRDGISMIVAKDHYYELDAKITQLETDLADIKLELSTPETIGMEKEPLYKWAASIVCAKLELQAKIAQLEKALKLAYEAMNYLGDILSNHDMVEPEDEAVTNEAFEVVSKIVGINHAEREAKECPKEETIIRDVKSKILDIESIAVEILGLLGDQALQEGGE